MPASSPRASATQTRSQVQAYLASLSADRRRALQALRRTIREAAPGAVEGFSYGIPGFRLDERPLLWYAAWKRHISLYPVGAAIRRALATQLEGYETAKGTVRFPLDDPPSAALVKRIVRARVAEVRTKGKA